MYHLLYILCCILLIYSIKMKLHLKFTLENYGSFLLVCFIFEEGSHCVAVADISYLPKWMSWIAFRPSLSLKWTDILDVKIPNLKFSCPLQIVNSDMIPQVQNLMPDFTTASNSSSRVSDILFLSSQALYLFALTHT